VLKRPLTRFARSSCRVAPNFQKRTLFGDPAQEILKTIESEGIDLVIMGTHGRKGLEHVFFGSVAENVVKSRPFPY